MLLRRVIEHVKTQNWTAVALDFVIVVVGVFIGIQVSNWNDARGDRAERDRLLVELIEDLSADIEEITGIIENTEVRIGAIATVFEAADIEVRRNFADASLTFNLASEGLTDPLSAGADYRPVSEKEYPLAMTFMRTLDGNRHTYNTLISTGSIRLISDAILARSIQAYYAKVDEVRDLENFIVNDRSSMFRLMHQEGFSRSGQPTLEELGEQLTASPELVAALRDFRYMTFNQWSSMVALRVQAEELIAALEASQ